MMVPNASRPIIIRKKTRDTKRKNAPRILASMLAHLLLFHRPFCFNCSDGVAVLARKLLQLLFGIGQFLLDRPHCGKREQMKSVAVCPALNLKNCSPYSIVVRTTVLCKVFASSTVHTNEKALSSSGSDWPYWMAPSKPTTAIEPTCMPCLYVGRAFGLGLVLNTGGVGD
jgi:hypothetical protein